MLGGPREHEGDRGAVVGGEEDPGGQTGDHPSVADLDVGVLDRTERDRPVHVRGGQDVGQADRAEAAVPRGEPEDLDTGQYGVERELEVGLLGLGELAAGGRELLRIAAEVLAQPRDHGRLAVRGRGRHRPHELLESRAERPGIRKVRHRR